MKNKKIALCGLLITLCLMLSYVEVLISFAFVIPGMKLGLTNIVILFALYKLDTRHALLINILRVVLSALLFTNFQTMLYSVCGAFLSFIAMYICKKINFLSIISVSIVGSIFHNIGQMIVASFFLNNNVFYFLPALLLTALVTGIVIGIVAKLTIERMNNI